ncbi:hypothetical protein AB0B45_16720 [Nonomuraea sp. NPDC049152]|uniref:hypothetical protein n=1 Tax=Nonomuraea sp. NPDC049152 TaxID=3154350 RepID=UPI0033CA26C8
MNRFLGVTAAAVIVLAGATPAAADPTVWKWGPVYSTDGHAEAKGAVAVGQSGFVVSGRLVDTRGAGCSWVQIKAMSSENGRWRTARFANCVPGSGSFRKGVGGVLQVRVRVCRGTATRETGRCSRWKTVYTQGG